MRKYAAKVDANHGEIVDALRQIGCSVLDLSRLGGGCPDIAAGKNNKTLLFEVKDGSKPPSARELTDDQKKFAENWRGHYAVVTCIQEAIDAVKAATNG